MFGPMETGREASEFDLRLLEYELPAELIAQAPPTHREEARLLAVDRVSGTITDRRIVDLPGLVRGGDLLVLNDTKVVPAKFFAMRQTGGRVKGLYLHSPSPRIWEVLLESSGRLRPGETLRVTKEGQSALAIQLVERRDGGAWLVQVEDRRSAETILAEIGWTPLPPYIRRDATGRPGDAVDRERYQTVYAAQAGAVAAPTAGLHFTERLLYQLRSRGVEIAFVTLHVGPGTFKPITAERIAGHVMHSERFELPAATAAAIHAAKDRGRRVIAVGTTTVRVLETIAQGAIGDRGSAVALAACSGETSIFIYPPYKFRLVDALLTNFHLPRSTLLALLMAFAGADLVRRAYAHAVAERYRFYSYGDAMLVE